MKLKDLFQKPVAKALGYVTRNYVKAPTFRPKQQVYGITYKAIDKIGESLSVYEPKALRANGEPYVNHPVIVLANNPNERMASASDFTHLYGMLMEIYGETFWYLSRGENTGRVKEIYLLDPYKMEVVAPQGELVGYKLYKDNGNIIPFTPEEIYHDKRPNPFNEWRGMSVLERAAVYVDTEISTANFTLNYIRNNASPSGIVSLPNMTTDTFKRFTSQWRENYEGPENAGKTAFIRGEGASFQAVGATLKDIDQKITREMAKEDVLMMLGVPKALLGMSEGEGLGRASLETLTYQFAKDKIEPAMRRLDRIYEHLAREMGYPIDVTHDSPVPEDKEFKHKMYRDFVNIAFTPNEVREFYGYEPIPEGDVLMDKRPNQPIEQKLKVVKAKSKAEKQAEQAEQMADKTEKIAEKYTAKIEYEVKRHFSNQEKIVIGKIDATSKAYEEWLFEIKPESEKMAQSILRIILAMAEEQVSDISNFLTGEPLMITPEMKLVYETEILKLSGNIHEDVLRKLEKTLTEGKTNNESVLKLKDRIEREYEPLKGARAETIARTESIKNANRANELAFKELGYKKKRWVVNYNACEFCRHFEGREIVIGGRFANQGDPVQGEDGGEMYLDYSDIEFPPLHPNCGCRLDPVL